MRLMSLIGMFIFVAIILVCVVVFKKSNKNPNNSNMQYKEKENNVFRYVISFLIPLVGYILGVILLSKDNADDKSVGKNCIILGIVSAIIGGVITAIFVSSMF